MMRVTRGSVRLLISLFTRDHRFLFGFVCEHYKDNFRRLDFRDENEEYKYRRRQKKASRITS